MNSRELSERLSAKFLLFMPARLTLRLMGRKPIIIEGATLNAEMQLCLAAGEGRPGMSALSPPQTRANLGRAARVHGLHVRNIVSRDFRIPTENGNSVPARFYKRARRKAGVPLLVFLHGGGFVLGDLDMYDDVCRYACEQTQFDVLSIEYRLAPEFPFPAGLEDSISAFRWARANAKELGSDPSRVLIGGDSAGGNLAAVAAQLLSKTPDRPYKQFLLYPTCDRSTEYPSAKLFETGFLLSKEDLIYFQKHYTDGIRHEDRGADFSEAHPRLSPLRSANLADLPPAFIVTSGFDPLRDEGEAYAHELKRAGTAVEQIRLSDMIHGFANLIGLSRDARARFRTVLLRLKEIVEEST